MRTTVFLLVITLFLGLSLKAKNYPSEMDSLKLALSKIEKEIETIKKTTFEGDIDEPYNIEKTYKVIKKDMNNKACCGAIVRTLPLSNKLLVLSPLFLTIIVLLIFLIILKRSGYSLTQALSTKKSSPDGETKHYASASKFLAFISIIIGLILAVFFFTFYFYLVFKHMRIPNFIGLWPIVVIIALGITPYLIQTIFRINKD